MSDEEQANLSERERAIRTKERLRELGYKSPNILALFGLRINHYTTFFYSTKERRSNHAVKIRAEYGEEMKLQFINPRKR